MPPVILLMVNVKVPCLMYMLQLYKVKLVDSLQKYLIIIYQHKWNIKFTKMPDRDQYQRGKSRKKCRKDRKQDVHQRKVKSRAEDKTHYLIHHLFSDELKNL